MTQTRSDNANTIGQRHAFFTEEMLKLLSPTKKDKNRSFSDLERRTIFYRDMGLCQWCWMSENDHNVPWEECEFHHVTPHADGGPTSIQNGVLVHRDCHPKRKEDTNLFYEWWHRTNPVPKKKYQKIRHYQIMPTIIGMLITLEIRHTLFNKIRWWWYEASVSRASAS